MCGTKPMTLFVCVVALGCPRASEREENVTTDKRQRASQERERVEQRQSVQRRASELMCGGEEPLVDINCCKDIRIRCFV